MPKKKVGIVGYGALGKYLAHEILNNQQVSVQIELAFVWNRTSAKLLQDNIPSQLILTDLNDFANHKVDLIVEVSHPDISANYGSSFLAQANYLIGSPSGLSQQSVEDSLREAANKNSSGHGLYIPRGALWGAEDIKLLADRNQLKELTITMAKHPLSLKLEGVLKERLDKAVEGQENVLFEGPVREICPLAPNNVNTMACAALAGHTLGFDGVKARLVSDSRLDAHVIDIEIVGPGNPPFTVTTRRYNPAKPGAITGNATYATFLTSLVTAAQGTGNGVHFC
eukprot:TRINITY_DN15823_c0_g1_i1.p1 TRINITY_DN15823_c0_g1~~TRINITY_DN15823_c0_g1_i1.p1  ORF type:complete len:283 (-),score=51.52 TRINITY_DN15823_c0_g1_i1:27-875(-)